MSSTTWSHLSNFTLLIIAVLISLIILEGIIILSSFTHPVVSKLYNFFLLQSFLLLQKAVVLDPTDLH